jgi:hypothetical protein
MQARRMAILPWPLTPGLWPLNMHYPAIPLIVHDPYFSVWSSTDTLFCSYADHSPCHWTGAPFCMHGGICVDGVAAAFMGENPWNLFAGEAKQVSCEVLPTRTIYVFEFRGVKLTVTFLTPALLHELKTLARPLTYILFKAEALDGKTHQCRVYFDCNQSICLNESCEEFTWGRLENASWRTMYVRGTAQPVLKKSGDAIRIDWGIFYLCLPKEQPGESCIGSRKECSERFSKNAPLPVNDSMAFGECKSNDGNFALATAFELPLGEERFIACAYDDEYSIEYFHRRLQSYWHTEFDSFAEMLSAAYAQKDELKAECSAFDELLMQQARSIGGDEYAAICALAYRQSIGAHKLVADIDGTPLFFSKENSSNGCIATVDITYPTAPLYLFLAPELVRGMLRPIFDYVEKTNRWHFPFAPHDIGQYPLANGQVYGGGEKTEEDQMPVEESGNLLLVCGALLRFHNDVEFLQQHENTLRTWAQYLLEKGFDPENQLCTDDFAGHLAHNTNLSLKAILALGAWAHITQALGNKGEAKHFYESALKMATQWTHDAEDGDHYRLAFDQSDTWSMKYNLVWDRLLDLRLFTNDVAEKEVAFYRKTQNAYGLPLDNRKDYTKMDWLVWCACLTGSREDFDALIHPIYTWLNEGVSRVPMSDWYMTTGHGEAMSFKARSVVGGVFLPFLYRLLADKI